MLLDLAGDYRNPAVHNRELLDFEVELSSGGAGQIRNQVALFRGMNAEKRTTGRLICDRGEHLCTMSTGSR